MFVAIVAIVAVSAVHVTSEGRVRVHRRWHDRLHRFTWGAGIEAMHQSRRERGRE